MEKEQQQLNNFRCPLVIAFLWGFEKYSENKLRCPFVEAVMSYLVNCLFILQQYLK